MEERRLKLVRLWVEPITFWLLIGLTQSFLNQSVAPAFWYIGLVFCFIILVLCIYSRTRNLKAIYHATVCIHIRMLVAFFQAEDILEADNPEQRSVNTVMYFMAIIMNLQIISHLFPRSKNITTVATMILINLGLM